MPADIVGKRFLKELHVLHAYPVPLTDWLLMKSYKWELAHQGNLFNTNMLFSILTVQYSEWLCSVECIYLRAVTARYFEPNLCLKSYTCLSIGVIECVGIFWVTRWRGCGGDWRHGPSSGLCGTVCSFSCTVFMFSGLLGCNCCYVMMSRCPMFCCRLCRPIMMFCGCLCCGRNSCRAVFGTVFSCKYSVV